MPLDSEERGAVVAALLAVVGVGLVAATVDATGAAGLPGRPPVVALFAAAGLGAAVVVRSASGDETVGSLESPRAGVDPPELSRFAAVAGHAADRIEANQATVDNAVYRTWREMTALLAARETGESAPTRRARTAGEFADAAVDAGLRADDVALLTRLFEEVRYGAMDPEPRTALAVRTLRKIEAGYGEGTGLPTEGEDDVDAVESDDDRHVAAGLRKPLV